MEKIKLTKIRTIALEHAPWNPRGAEELAWDHPKMAELIQSVQAHGITQSLAVWDRGNGEPLLVIAGNRRLEAARAVGLIEVPALLFSGIDEVRAHEITRTENEIRQGVDPLQDAQLIERMLSKGMDQKTIAAHFGMSEAMVCRRAKLINLDESVRAVAAETQSVAVDALEQISLYPTEVQRSVASDIRRYAANGSLVRWCDISWRIRQQTRSLDDAAFATDGCVSCPNRTGAQPDLWADMPEDGSLGQCICKECFQRKLREFDLAALEALAGDGVELIDAENAGYSRWSFRDDDDFGVKRSKSRPCAWYWIDAYSSPTSDERYKILYGPTLDEIRRRDEEREKLAAQESEERRAFEEAERAEKQRIDEECSALDDKVGEAAKVIVARLNSASPTVRLAAIKKHVASVQLKGAAANLIAGLVDEMMVYSNNNEENCDLLAAVPKLAEALKITAAEVAAYKQAQKRLKDFNAAHAGK